MTKHRWREKIKSFLGHHIAYEKSQELENEKNGIDNKVAKMLRLIKEEENEENGQPGSFNKQSELVDLIKDVPERYQSLYTLYSDLIRELRDTVHSREEKNGRSSSSSSSDSDSDHSRDEAHKNKKQNDELQKLEEKLKLELEALDQKFRAAVKNNETLKSEHVLALSKIEQTEKKIKELQTKAEKLEDERLKLWIENEKMTKKLEEAHNFEAVLELRLEDVELENETMTGLNLRNLSRIDEQTEVILKADKEKKRIADKLGELVEILKEQLEPFEENSKLCLDNEELMLELEAVRNSVTELEQRLNYLLAKLISVCSRIGELEEEKHRLEAGVNEWEPDMDSLRLENVDLKERVVNKSVELSSLSRKLYESENDASTE